MADPARITCNADEWTIVATNVTSGQVNRLNKKPNLYLQTYRMTGNAAPTDITEGVPVFVDSESEEIASAAGIDVYIMAVGQDGEIRIDV
jgi:hypothetical protein